MGWLGVDWGIVSMVFGLVLSPVSAYFGWWGDRAKNKTVLYFAAILGVVAMASWLLGLLVLR